MADDQRDIVAFLADPASYGAGIGKVERLETHISRVFLAGDRAYKLKRAVCYPYVDFSTVEKRRRACAAELRLNRRTAPELYLETRAITRSACGQLGWDGDGDVLDWVVVMRRFDQDHRLDAIAAAGGLEPRLLHALAAHIVNFHAKAEKRSDFGGAAGVEAVMLENDAMLRQVGEPVFAGERIEELRDRSEDGLRRLGALLDRRRADGKVRHCHGDLHLRNICVLDGKPVLFDCIEFSEAFACIDVLYDLAFLLMDLQHQGDPAAANLVLNRYLDLSGEDDGLAAMPLFFALRAAIRAHVTATAGGDGAVETARSYLDLAGAALRPAAPRLVAIGGFSGTGKSTLAAALAPELGLPPGARVLRSDVLRKRLFGVDPEARLPENAYTSDVTARVYAALCDRAGAALGAGYCAIIDAVSLRVEERRAFAAVAAAAGVPFAGIWLEAPAATLASRVGARQHDASDATQEIVERQLRIDPGPLDWRRIDAGHSTEATLAAMRKAIA
jgi:aminoglycoside phosphotransferase family enzyme/predicted kinase